MDKDLSTPLGEKREAAVPDLHIGRFDIPDAPGLRFARRLRAGWNLGNTFDATRRGFSGPNEMVLETVWCGVRTTDAVIGAVAAAGFGTLRIPVSWHDHVDADLNISPRWLDRVQEVADMALRRGLYVILNTHHDETPEHLSFTKELYPTAERYLTRVWHQLCDRFAGYDEHLIFESMNEPRLKGHALEWRFTPEDPDCRAAAECVDLLDQAFVDTVRSSGGHNRDRFLMVPGYAAAPAHPLSGLFTLPEDPVPGRLALSVHAYTPYSFALDRTGETSFSLTDERQTGEITAFMDGLYRRFISKGIPVVLGEFGALDKGGPLRDRVDYTAFYVASAAARGMPCCWWDNNAFSGRGENFGLLDRRTCLWPYPQIVDAIMRYAPKDDMD